MPSGFGAPHFNQVAGLIPHQAAGIRLVMTWGKINRVVRLATRAATMGWSRSAAPTLLAPAGLPSPVTASEKNSRLIAMNCLRGPGTSASS